MSEILRFSEHEVSVSGTSEDLRNLADFLIDSEIDNTWHDLAYRIKVALDDEFREEVENDVSE